VSRLSSAARGLIGARSYDDPEPVADFDLTDNPLEPAILFERLSTALYYDSDGVLTEAAKDEPCVGYAWDGAAWVEQGLLIRSGETGLHQSSGTDAKWTVDAPDFTVTRSNITVDGLPVVRVQIAGTAPNTATRRILFEAEGYVGGWAVNQLATSVLHMVRHAGSMTGLTAVGLQVREVVSGVVTGSSLLAPVYSGSNPIPDDGITEVAPVGVTKVLDSASASIVPVLYWTPQAGVAIDITLDIHVQTIRGADYGREPLVTTAGPETRDVEEVTLTGLEPGTYDILVDTPEGPSFWNGQAVGSTWIVEPPDGARAVSRVRFYPAKRMSTPGRRALAPDDLPEPVADLIASDVVLDDDGLVERLGTGAAHVTFPEGARPSLVEGDTPYLQVTGGQYGVGVDIPISDNMTIAMVFQSDLGLTVSERYALIGNANIAGVLALDFHGYSLGAPATLTNSFGFVSATVPAIEPGETWNVVIYTTDGAFSAWDVNGVIGCDEVLEQDYVFTDTTLRELFRRRDPALGTPYYFDGNFQHLLVFDEPLTQAQRTRLMDKLMYERPGGIEVVQQPERTVMGAVTHESFQLVSGIAKAADSVTLNVYEADDLDTVVWTDTQAPVSLPLKPSGALRQVYFEPDGLDPETAYTAILTIDGMAYDTLACTVTTAPTPGTPAVHRFAVSSCTGLNRSRYSFGHASMMLDDLDFFAHIGDIVYDDSLSLDVREKRGTFPRPYLECASVARFHRVCPTVFMFDDHDNSGGDESGLHKTNGAELNRITRQVYRETLPHYPFLQAELGETDPDQTIITQTATWGCIRHIFVDTRSQFDADEDTMIGDYWWPEHMQAIKDALVEAGTDGMRHVFLHIPTAWQNAGGPDTGIERYAPDERAELCDFIRDTAGVPPVTLINGDLHGCGVDDGGATDFSTGGGLNMIQVLASALWQNAKWIQPFEFDGREGMCTGIGYKPFSYAEIECALDGRPTITIRGAPYDGDVAGVLDTFALSERTPLIELVDPEQTYDEGDPITLTVTRDWQADYLNGGCDWSASNGESGTVAFTNPNSGETTISLTAPASSSVTITLSNPDTGVTVGDPLVLVVILAETTALLAEFDVAPDGTRAGLINTLIAGMKTDGVWSKLGSFAVLAAHDAQAGRVDWKDPTKVFTASGTITFTTDRGFAGNGTDGYLEHPDNLDAIPGFTQNSASMGVWCLTNVSASVAAIGQATSNRSYIRPHDTSNVQWRANGASTITALPASTSVGLTAWSRVDASNSRLFKDGALLATAGVSGAITSTKFCLLRDGAGFSTVQVAAGLAGASLTDADHAAIHSRIGAYLSAIGAA
jgi:hypothetical protein